MTKNDLVAFSGIPFSPAALTKPAAGLDRGYAPRLQLVSTGTSNLAMDGKCAVGNFAIVDGSEVVDVGDSQVVIPLCKLNKAVDFSDGDDVKSSFDPESDEYQRIQNECDTVGYDSGCMYGPVYLAFETQTCQFVEIFLNNKSGRLIESRFDVFLPISSEAADLHSIEARAPQPVSLTSKMVESKKGPKKNRWFVPVVAAFQGDLNVAEPPAPEAIAKACSNFIKQADVEADDRER